MPGTASAEADRASMGSLQGREVVAGLAGVPHVRAHLDHAQDRPKANTYNY
jgi:hypothetical protein